MCWPALIGGFKISRVQITNAVVLFIIIVAYLILTMHEAAQWQAYLEVMHMTWVRAPGLSYPQYYFSNNNHVQVNVAVP